MMLVAPVVLLFCILLDLAASPVAYHVGVSSSPQSPVPFTVHTVKLNCSITPLPPGPVQYSWTTVPKAPFTDNPYSSNSSLPTATAYIYHDTARYTTHYCHAHFNGNKVATGKLTLTIQGRKRL